MTRPLHATLLVGVALVLSFGVGLYVGKFQNIPFVEREQAWAIGIFEGASPFDLAPAAGADNPVVSAADVTDVPATFVADPFLLLEDETWHMFFEVMNAESGHGDIALATSSDGTAWTYRQVVLDEPSHLSYPYVFEWEGTHYMMPSGSGTDIRLYRAEGFPTAWALDRVLVTGRYVDPSLVRHQGRWWLFVAPPESDALHLFYADSLAGPWAGHAANPIVRGDPDVSRPGGRVGALDGRLIRYSQDTSPVYGNQVRAFEIIEMTPTAYREARAAAGPVLGPSGTGWNRDGMHHIDPHRTEDGTWLAGVDGFAFRLRPGLRR